MVDEVTRRRGFSGTAVALAAVVTLVVGLAVGFLIAHASNGPGSTTPDPETVTCQQWTGLPQSQKDDILATLNSKHGSHVERQDVTWSCGLTTPDRPVAGIVVQDA